MAGDVVVRISGDVDGFNKAAAQVNGSLKNVGDNGAQMGAALSRGLEVGGAALAGLAVAAFKLGSDFDSAYDGILTKTGATGEKLEGLGASFRNVVANVPTDFGNASNAIAALSVRTGLAGEPLETLAGQMLEFSRLFGGEVTENIRLATRVMGDWSIPASEMGSTLDKIARVSQLTGISTQELMQKIVQFGAPLRQMGFDFETTALLMGKWEKEGVNADLVLGSLRIGLGEFARISADSSGRLKDFTAETKKAGGPAADLKILLAEMGAAGATTGEQLQHVIAAIRDSGSTATANAIAMDIFGAKAGPDMAAAIREGRFSLGELDGSLEDSQGTVMDTAAATEDAQERMNKAFNKLKLQAAPLAEEAFNIVGEAALNFAGIIDQVIFIAENNRLPEAMAELGRNAADGLMNALWSASIPGQVHQLFLDITGAANEAIEAHSPSKVFMEIGQNMMAGLELGIIDHADQVRSALHELLAPGELDAALRKIISTEGVDAAVNHMLRIGKTTEETMRVITQVLESIPPTVDEAIDRIYMLRDAEESLVTFLRADGDLIAATEIFTALGFNAEQAAAKVVSAWDQIKADNKKMWDDIAARQATAVEAMSQRMVDFNNKLHDTWVATQNFLGGFDTMEQKMAHEAFVSGQYEDTGSTDARTHASLQLAELQKQAKAFAKKVVTGNMIGGFTEEQVAKLQAALPRAGAYRGRIQEALAIMQAAMGKLPNFDLGGMVGGALGSPSLAVVHGGETVLPAGAGGPVVNFYGPVYGMDDFNRKVAEAVTTTHRRGGLSFLGNN